MFKNYMFWNNSKKCVFEQTILIKYLFLIYLILTLSEYGYPSWIWTEKLPAWNMLAGTTWELELLVGYLYKIFVTSGVILFEYYNNNVI